MYSFLGSGMGTAMLVKNELKLAISNSVFR